MQIDTAFITEAIENADKRLKKNLIEAIEEEDFSLAGMFLDDMIVVHKEALEEETRDNPSQADMEKELNEDADRAGIR